ncbi:tetratricopeptide repeat protein [Methanocorpusculum bavaricum]|jgi:tetratricopeptide (TPR) repeat protein|uniref:tetratricopeptide repeat protein n=1 Tax=Methanocorpusculum bavaricum TaxID=71518 RepID=UPI0005B26714|nr:tetratricopeptide repeat protein [Methanocorpusculum bavaricum]
MIQNERYQFLYNQGVMNLNRGRYAEALKSFENARRESDNSYAYSGIGRAYYGLGKYSDALKNFEIACVRYSGNIQAAHWMAKTLGKMKRYSEAEAQFNVVLRRLGNGPINFYQEVYADYEDMKDEREGRKPRGSVHKPPMSYSVNKDSSTKIIINGDVSAPVNIGGIQATDDAIINRAEIDNSAKKEVVGFNSKKDGFFSKIFGSKKSTCPDCGTTIQNNQKYCNNCGRKLE